MGKWYEVTVKSVTSYLVEVNEDGSEDPEEVVAETMFSSDWDEMESMPVAERHLESYKRHTPKDKILAL